MPHPHLHKCNTFNTCKPDITDTESHYDMEELYMACEELDIPRHFTTTPIEFHKHYNNTTDNEQSQLDTSSEDEHSLMDFEITPMPTHMVTTPPIPHPRSSRTHPLPVPWPSKVNNKVKTCSEAPQDNVKHHIKHLHTPNQENTIVTHTPPCQFENKQEEHSFQDHHNTAETSIIHTFQDLTDNNHHYYPVHHRDQTSFKDISICKYYFFLPVLVITLTDHFMSLLASHAACQAQFTQETWSTCAY